jgi:hypothetical protein
MEMLIVWTLWVMAGAVALFVLYLVIRAGVRDGMIAARAQIDRDEMRAELGVGRESSPNTRNTDR